MIYHNATATRRVLAIPELLRSIFFSLPDRGDNYCTTLVCRVWSEIALDVLWYEVDDMSALFHLLVPLNSPKKDIKTCQKFVRRPEPQDWTVFGKISRRVKKLTIEADTVLPSRSVFDDITKTRIHHEILPNLWSLKWLSDASLGVIFLHAGIQELAFQIDYRFLDEAKIFMRNTSFFSRNITTISIETCSENGLMDPQPVGLIEAELTSWLAQLHDLRVLDIPRFWLTSHVFKTLGQLPHLVHLDFKLDPGQYGNPLDTLIFRPISDSEEIVPEHQLFPSLIDLGHNTRFSEMTRFLSCWQGSSRLSELSIASQVLESPDAFRSALDIITVQCPRLTFLGLTCLRTPYRHHPGGSLRPRITLNTLLPLRNLKDLLTLELVHPLPFAFTDEEFLFLVKEWSQMQYLGFGCDPYPLDNDVVHTAESLLPTVEPVDDASLTPTYPIIGLWQSMKSLRKHCPSLQELFLFGIDDFTAGNDKARLASDELAPLPFPSLKTLSFGSSPITSKSTVIALALSQFLLPSTSFFLHGLQAGDQHSPYLTYLNLNPLIPLRDQLPASLQKIIDSADPSPPDLPWTQGSPNIAVNEPVGVGGVIDDDTLSIFDERRELEKDITSFLEVLCEAREDEREKARWRCIDCPAVLDFGYIYGSQCIPDVGP
ncbi:hypothetical protein BDN72DRAFT_965365 [Pluteus cervinus]|uniref:Uncharacterized protein n=1 Tax=Pluteus cervinus TaxID=181527 RepID=A0ACD3A5W7_9AGAR|nr:hypothetical protein BDN72DRAFT_965365 [Pluteus cervinus]